MSLGLVVLYCLFALVLLLVNLYFSLTFADFASQKGYPPVKYFWLCFFFMVLGYCWVAVLPDMHLQREVNVLREKVNALSTMLPKTNEPAKKWTCGDCGTENSYNFGQCKRCGAKINNALQND